MVLLCIWIAYATVRVLSQDNFFVAKYHYLSPFTSPCVTASCPDDARDFGTWFGSFPPFLPLAIISLVFLGERMTPWRIAAALCIIAGVIALRLG